MDGAYPRTIPFPCDDLTRSTGGPGGGGLPPGVPGPHEGDGPDLMGTHRTNGSRAIPRLIAPDEEGIELFTYGPRPTPAAELFERHREEGVPKEEIYRELRRWYDEDGGDAVDEELAARLVSLPVPDSA